LQECWGDAHARRIRAGGERWDETFDIGADTGAPVDDKDCQVPVTFDYKSIDPLRRLLLTGDAAIAKAASAPAYVRIHDIND
jgi:hypothetical protein